MIRPAFISLAELPDDLFVAREDDRRVPQAAGMIHVDAHLQRLIDGLRPIHRKHREQFFDRQRMFAADALNRRDQQLGFRLHGYANQTRDIGGLLPDRHGLHKSGLRIDHRPRQQSRSLSHCRCARPAPQICFSTTS